MARTKVRINTKSDDLTSLKNEVVKCKNGLNARFIKLAGKSFGLYQSREIDKFITKAYEIVKHDLFKEFAPKDDQMPLCVVATGSYALSEMTIKSKIDLAIIYKNICGYASEHIATSLGSALNAVSLDANTKIYEIESFFDTIKDDIETKTLFYQVRFVCGSKQLYKLCKEQICELKNYKKDEFIAFHLSKFGRYDMLNSLSARPNLRDGYGGFYDYKRIFWLLNMIDENTPRTHAFKFIDEKENSEINLAVDFVSSLRSALQICGGESELGAEFLPQITKVMQTKEKRQLDTKSLLFSKTLASMQTIAIYSRFLAEVIFEGGSCEQFSVKEWLGRLLNLTKPLGVTEIFSLKRAPVSKEIVEENFETFVSLFGSKNAGLALKALKEARLLFYFVKPLESLENLLLEGCEFCLDEQAVRTVMALDSLKNTKARQIWESLLPDERFLMRICGLFGVLGEVEFGGSAANIFRSYANKCGISNELVATGVNLVKNQNLMISMESEDIYNQATLLNFVSYFGSQKSLEMLFVMSLAVLEAKNHLTSYATKSLSELFDMSLSVLNSASESLLDEATKRAKKEQSLKKQREFSTLSKEEQEEILSIKSNLLFVKYSPAEILNVASFAKERLGINVRVTNGDSLCVEMVVKSGWNVVGVLQALGEFDLVYMEIFELFGGKIFVLLEFARRADDENAIEKDVIGALCAAKQQVSFVPQICVSETHFDLNHSKNIALVKINAKDQRGLMAFVLSVFEEFGVSVVSARIQTIKNRTRNLFLLKKDENLNLNYTKVLARLTTA